MIITLFLCLCILLFIIVAYFIDFSPVPLPLIPMIVFIMLTFIMAFIHKVRKQCKKFGAKNVFRMSYHGKQIEMEDYVCAMLEQVPGFHKIEKWGETIVYLNDTGIYLIQYF